MKRTRQLVPTTQTGDAATDGGSQGITMPTKGGRNATTEQSRRGAGQLAPKPSGGAALLGNDRPSHPTMSSMARVMNRPSSGSGASGPSGSFNPLQNNAMTNLRNTQVGQPNPNTSAAATAKPKRKGLGSAFYGEM
jgi:hypothetical protein